MYNCITYLKLAFPILKTDELKNIRIHAFQFQTKCILPKQWKHLSVILCNRVMPMRNEANELMNLLTMEGVRVLFSYLYHFTPGICIYIVINYKDSYKVFCLSINLSC